MKLLKVETKIFLKDFEERAKNLIINKFLKKSNQKK